MIRTKVEGEAPLTEHSVLTFGKHKNHTYANVKAMYPDYCAWVLMTANESEDCDLGLYRFASCLQHPASYQSEKTSK